MADDLIIDSAEITALEVGGVRKYKDNISSSADPGAGDDSDDGYGVGSTWVNIVDDTIWRCADATPTAAVWKDVTDIGGVFLVHKAGVVAGASFSSGGSPARQQYAVVFSTAFADNNYAVTIATEESKTFKIVSKTASGFTLRSSSNAAMSLNTFWTAVKVGESV